MSGSYPSSGINQALNLVPVSLDTLPLSNREGSKCAYFNISWAAILAQYSNPPFVTAKLNLLQQFQTGNFTTVQAVYIDNSTCAAAVLVTCDQTGQNITLNAFSQGMFPIVCNYSPSFTIQALFPYSNGVIQYSTCTTKFFFLNTPQKPFVNTIDQLTTTSFVSNGTFSANPVSIGLAAFSPGTGFRWIWRDLVVSITIGSSFAAGTPVYLSLIEMPGAYTRVQFLDWAPAGVTGLLNYRIFSNGVVQLYDNTTWDLYISVLPAGGGATVSWAVQAQLGLVQCA